MKRILRLPSPAMAVALVALFTALAGSAYAATVITGKNVKNGSLTGADVRTNSLTGSDVTGLRGADVKSSGLTGSDIASSSIAGNDIKNEALAARDIKKGSLTSDRFGPGQLARWALVDENGAIIEQSGGFTVASRPGVNGQPATNPNIYINAGASLLGKGLNVSTAIQNRLDRSGDGAADPAFTGDVAVGRCNTTAVMCVPTGTNTDNTLVVRSLADNTAAASQTRRFYVEVTP